MGQAGKSRRASKRKAMKKAEKDRKKALYASYAGTGKRSKKRFKSVEAGKFNHATSNCGNNGCKKCYSR